jgi:hypothetical protein
MTRYQEPGDIRQYMRERMYRPVYRPFVAA